METLEVVPLDGTRALRRNDFTLTGQSSEISSHTYARLEGERIKGFTLIWPADDEKRQRLALTEMQASFRAVDGVLPESLGGQQSIDLVAGLEIRRADETRSGFYIDAAGSVLTAAAGVDSCARITLGDDLEAKVVAIEPSLGLAVLQPLQAVSPIGFAALTAQEPRLQSEVAVSGFSYGGLLSAPSLTYGKFADVKGLDGNMQVQRLDVAAEPGDAGGPVFDGGGSVMGMLLDAPEGARQLPAGVSFAADAPVLAAFLARNGVTAIEQVTESPMEPEDLAIMAADITVLVSCWN